MKQQEASENQLIEKEIRNIRKNNSVAHDIPIEDLVMMQMAGDFDKFLNTLPSNGSVPDFTKALRIIESTKKDVTARDSLFANIVNKTIEAQFGNKYAALRELGQNAIDAYASKADKRPVDFTTEDHGTHLLVKVKDSGVGMNAQELVRDLLIPYNSGKELDPTKIGEHGIGWYSVVDLADMVKVTTRKATSLPLQVAVYRNKKKWISTIAGKEATASEAGNHGTIVEAYIPKENIEESVLKDTIYQNLGMVRKNDAQITLNGEPVNILRDQYTEAPSVTVRTNKEYKPLIMGVSKRELMSESGDAHFSKRNKNLESIIQTQRGLFIKYEKIPFDDRSLHYSLIHDLMHSGLDFWIDVPEDVTLTKGRNSIVADDAAAVLEGTYTAFENLFLEVLLNDEELLQHPSGALIEAIAHMFDKAYHMRVEHNEEQKFSFKRRVASRTAEIGSGMIDIAKYLTGEIADKTTSFAGWGFEMAKAATQGVGTGAKYVFTELPRNIAGGIAGLTLDDVVDVAKDVTTETAKAAKKWVPIGIGGGLVGYGLLSAYEKWGWKPFKYTLGTVSAIVAAKLLYEGGKKTADFLKHASFDTHTGAPNALGEKIKEGLTWLREKVGLYVNVEEKRKRKQNKQREKISRKYLSSLQKDLFFKKIMDKKIIPAIEYYSTAPKKGERKTLQFDGAANAGTYTYEEYAYERINKIWDLVETYRPATHERDVKVSIDDLVDLHLRGHLRVDKARHASSTMYDGDYLVSENNPLVSTVTKRLKEISYQVKDKYDVKVLEDHLDNIWSTTKELATIAYFMSGIGIANFFISNAIKGIPNVADGTQTNKFISAMYHGGKERLRDYIKMKHESIKDKKWDPRDSIVNSIVRTGNRLGDVAKGCVGLTAAAGLGGYRLIVRPLQDILHPAQYPAYAKSIGKSMVSVAKGVSPYVTSLKVPRTMFRYGRNTLQSIADFASEWKESAYWGEADSSGRGFSNLTEQQLSDIVEKVGVGQAYTTYVSGIKIIEKHLSKALGTKEADLVLTSSSTGSVGQGFEYRAKNQLRIFVGDLEKDIRDIGKRHTGWTKEIDKARDDYLILDYLIHQRAHAALPDVSCSVDHGDQGHTFYEEKARIRERVAEYLTGNNINLSAEIDTASPPFEVRKHSQFYVGAGTIAGLIKKPDSYLQKRRKEFEEEEKIWEKSREASKKR